MSDSSKIEELQLKLLEIRIAALEEFNDKYDRLMEKLIESNSVFAQRVVALETNQENMAQSLKKINDDNKLQNKLLSAVAAASVGTLITILLKSALMH